MPCLLHCECLTCMRARLGDDTLIPLLIPSDRLLLYSYPDSRPLCLPCCDAA